ncbi:aminoglycoside phosphotransferase family protein [Patescibacteria group bacterium]
MILYYSDKIPQQIPKVIDEALNLKVESLERLEGGQVNYSFLVGTNNDFLLVRVFRYDDWPVKKKLLFIEKKLNELGIKQPKIIFFDDSDKYFQNGFMVREWVEGMPSIEAVKKGLITENKIFTEIAKILKKVHTIEFDKFGQPPFDNKSEGTKNFTSFVLGLDEKRLNKMIEENLVKIDLIESGKNKLKNLLDKIDFTVKPVMVHGDATPKNVILTEKGLALIDWDDVKANAWIYDLAYTSYHWGHKFREPFLKGYGVCPEETSQIELLENIFHIRLGLKLLPYYAYEIQNEKNLNLTIKKLQKILSRS